MVRFRPLVFLVVVLTLALLAVPIQTIHAQDATPEAPPAPEATPAPRFTTTVEVDGRRVGLTCEGSGSPTVVLIGGARSPADRVWPVTVDGISPITRVCVFERAGLGPSDPPPNRPQTAADVVADLDAALAAAGEAGPFVPVGFSAGGYFARLYASTRPDKVVGLVLVEGSPPGIAVALLHMQYLASVGLDFHVILAGLDDPEFAAPINELVSEAQVLAVPPPRVPAIVIVAGKLDLRDLEGFEGTDVALEVLEYNAALHEAQAAQARDLSARVVFAEDSGHFVPLDQPEVIIAAIEDVVAAVRDPSSWATPAAATPAA